MAKRKGVAARRGLKEARSDRRGPMDKNRVRGGWRRASGPTTAKSISVKRARRRPGGRASKAVGLTPGDLRRVPDSGLRTS